MAKRGRPKKHIASDNALEILAFDHGRIRDFFQRIEAARGQRRRAMIEKVCSELDIHASVEEEIFYPALEAEGNESMKTFVSKSLAEHKTVNNLISELKDGSINENEYEEKFQMMKENVESHAKEEEEALFPDVEKLMGEKLNGLGIEIKERKQELEQEAKTAG